MDLGNILEAKPARLADGLDVKEVGVKEEDKSRMTPRFQA